MKKQLYLFVTVLLTFFILTGCTAGESTGRSVEIPPETRLYGMHDGKIILAGYPESVDGITRSNIEYYTLPLEGGEPFLFGELKNWLTQGSKNLIMSDGRMYVAACAGEEAAHQLWAFPLDGSAPELIEEEKGDRLSLRSLARLNEDEFVVHGWEWLNEEGTDRARSVVKKYNVTTGEYKVLLDEEIDRAIPQGKELCQVACDDNKIYVYSRAVKENSSSDPMLEVYDSDGNLLEEHRFEPVIRETDGFYEMWVYGDYFVFNEGDVSSIFKLTDGTFEKIESYDGFGVYYHSIGAEITPVEQIFLKDHYLDVPGSDEPLSEMKSFTFEDEKTTSINIEIDPERPNVEDFVVSEKGELVLVMSDGLYYDYGANRMLYYFTADEADALFN